MWSIFGGTIVNVITVALGSLLGILASKRVPDKYQRIVLVSLGLVTITLGMDAGVLKFASTVDRFAPLVDHSQTYGARLAVAMICSLIVGSIIGTALRLHDRIESLGRWVHSRFSDGPSHGFAEGFLTASVIFCVGPLTLLGCIRNGAEANADYLYIKSVLDGFCSMALASTLGWGVFASVITVVGVQGSLSLLAYYVAQPLDELSLALMTIVGGIILLATAFMILDIKKIPVADMLPGIFLAPVFIWLSQKIAPGMLLPIALPAA